MVSRAATFDFIAVKDRNGKTISFRPKGLLEGAGGYAAVDDPETARDIAEYLAKVYAHFSGSLPKN